MAALFDTGALERLRRREREAELAAIRYDPPVICTHVVAEALYGWFLTPLSNSALRESREFLASFEVLVPGVETASIYANLRVDLQRAGLQLPDPDIWIAAHAMEGRLRLVTLDGHFDYITGLTVHRLPQ